jgi:hypothetical protein
MRQAIEDSTIYPRFAEGYADRVILGTLTKAFSLAEAALILIKNDHPEEGFGLARSVVECALNLRYLTQDRDERESRALAFVSFFKKEKQYWLHQAKEFLKDRKALDEMDKYAAE